MKLNKPSLYNWPKEELMKLKKLSSAGKIQDFLDSCKYNKSSKMHIPSEVLIKKKAHCFDGAIFAASVLNYFGQEALIMDLCAIRDDDHILTIYREGKYLGAIAKSNYTGLRFREAIFKNERELALSYFESYFNLKREKTLREYSQIYNLNKIRNLNWENSDEAFEQIAINLEKSKHYKILNTLQIGKLNGVDSRTFSAGLTGLI